MKQFAIAIISVLLVSLAGCAKQTATGNQTATITLKDGTTATGTVTKSDTSSVTIQTPSGVVSTYPMSQVASINYAPAAASTASNTPPPQQPAATTPAGQENAPSASAPPSGPPPAGTPPTAPPPDHDYVPAETFHTIPSGTTLAVRTDQAIDSHTAASGQTYSGVVARNVLDSDGKVAIPRGASATLVIRDAQAQGKFQGQSELAVDVAAVRVEGRQYRLETSDFVERGRQGVGTNRRPAEFTGGGTALGTIIGAIAGGGKGAAIGALSGAAAGATTQSVTRGKGARIPAETVLNFRLEAPIRIREMR